MTISSALIAYISSIQQIVFDAFHEGHYIGLVFACIAAPMALASWLNSRFVGRFGLRRVGHTRGSCARRVDGCSRGRCLQATRRRRSSSSCRAWMACFASPRRTSVRSRWRIWRRSRELPSSVQGVGTVGAALLGFLIGRRSMEQCGRSWSGLRLRGRRLPDRS